jgi:hypothetical protein
MYHGASVIMHRTFPWKHSSISMLEMEAEPQSCIIGPDGFEDDFIGLKFVTYREFGLMA